MLDIDDIAEVIADAVREATAPLLVRIDELERRELLLPEKGEPGRDGADCDMEAVERMIEERIAALPAPALGEPGRDGKDADMDLVMRRIAEEVVTAVTTLPPAAKGEDGKDGIGLADALIDKDGNLVLTMTNGQTKTLGVVVGKDGEPGADGENGKDGETFSLDDFDIEQIDERSFKFKFTKGAVCHSFEFAFPVIIDAGVWSSEKSYAAGDAVSWGGSLWIAQKDAPGKPDTADSGWRLAVKKGRDGRDAK